MPRYLLSFADGAMDGSEEKLPDVANAAHEMVQNARGAGVWVFGGQEVRECLPDPTA